MCMQHFFLPPTEARLFREIERNDITGINTILNNNPIFDSRHKARTIMFIYCAAFDKPEAIAKIAQIPELNINSRDVQNGNTALIYASFKNSLLDVNKLIKIRGINFNMQNNAGKTALMYCVINGNPTIAKALSRNFTKLSLNVRLRAFKEAVRTKKFKVASEIMPFLSIQGAINTGSLTALGLTIYATATNQF